jgi:large subunit ribosomal protein L38e
MTARRKDIKVVNIKKSGGVTKFKVRGARFTYTLKVADESRAAKIKESLPSSLTVQMVDDKKKKSKN